MTTLLLFVLIVFLSLVIDVHIVFLNTALDSDDP